MMVLLVLALLSLLSPWAHEQQQNCCSSLPLRCWGGHGPVLEAFVSPKDENGQLVAPKLLTWKETGQPIP